MILIHGVASKSIEIENMENSMEKFYIDSCQRNENNKTTVLKIVYSPKLYYDEYILTKLIDKNDNVYEYNYKLSLMLFKEINSADNWQTEFKDGYIEGQNYKITGNIDFSERTDQDISVKDKLKIGRIVGETGTRWTISNYTRESASI